MDRKSLHRHLSLMRSWNGDGPAEGFGVTLEVAFRCNVRCVFCSRWDDPTDLRLETIRDIAEDMRDLGASYVSLTGGDPFVRPDFREIVDAFAEHGVDVHINTNGVLLAKFADFLIARSKAIRSVTVSIDSPVADVHDEIRGVPGTFRRALVGMERIRDHIPVSLACTLNQKNLHEIEAYHRFAGDLGYDYRFQPLHEDGDNQLTPNEEGVAVERSALDGLTERLNRTVDPGDSFSKRQYYRLFEPFFRDRDGMSSLRCTTAARLIYFIDPKGDVYPCDTRRDFKLGNVYQRRFSEIVRGRESDSWRATCRRRENGCWCMYACVAPNNVRYQDLPLLPLGREGFPVRKRWERRFQRPKTPAAAVPDGSPAAAIRLGEAVPFVSIVMASFNGGEFLQQSVQAMLALDHATHRRELVLVDDGSDDGSVEALKGRFAAALESGALRIVRNETPTGVPAAYNRGVEASSPEARYVLKVDNDLIPRSDALGCMVALAEANPTAGIVGGRVYFHTDPERIQYLGGMLASSLRGPAAVETPDAMLRDPAGCGPRWVDVVNSCMSLVRREVFETAGLYPEFYGRYEYEDYDFAYRARRFGFRGLYCPDAVGYHAVSLTSSVNDLGRLRARQRARNGVLFMRRWAPRGWWVGYLLYHLAKIPADALRHGQPAGALWSGYLEGMRESRRGDLEYRRLAPGKRGKRRDVTGLAVVQNA